MRNGGEKLEEAQPGFWSFRHVDTSVRLPEGMRAFGLVVPASSFPAGLAALPGARVDVILHIEMGENEFTLRRVLEDVLVLSADHRTGSQGVNDQKSAVVTLALNNDDLRTLTTAQQTGTITLLLRLPRGD